MDAELSLQRQRTIDGGKGVAATSVVLEGHARDMKIAAERGDRCLPVWSIAHGATQAGVAFQNIQRPGDASARHLCRQHTGFCRPSRVQRFRHRIHAKGLLQASGKGADGGQGMRVRRAVELVQRRRCSGGAKAADRAGVVPVLVMRAAQCGADAGRDFVAGDHGFEHLQAVGLLLLADGPSRSDGGSARVVNRFSVNVIDFDRVRGRAIDQGGGARARGTPEREPRLTSV